jgi:hypothetical protein
MRILFRSTLLSAMALTTALSACHDNSNDDAPAVARFEITFTNLTAGQPMTPLALIAHDATYQSFVPGKPASIALEKLAESGDNGMLLSEAKASTIHVWQASSGAGMVMPGKSETQVLDIPIAQIASARLSVLSMLANTNDAFAASNSTAIGVLPIGQSLSVDLPVYDAGTEANIETADSMPGPASAGGLREGFNPVRDDSGNQIGIHSGVLTRDDGLPGSVLTQMHRWDNPAARLFVRRVQ